VQSVRRADSCYSQERAVEPKRDRKSHRTDEVLRFFIDRFSGEVGRVVLVKLAYLADLESWRHLGRALSDLRYRVDNYGPFDPSFFHSLERLLENGLVSEAKVPLATGTCYRYSSRQARPYHFNESELVVLNYIAMAFRGKKMGDVLDVAYSTEQFIAAKKRGKGAEVRLKDAKFQGAAEIGEVRLENVVEAFAAIKEGKYVDADEWIGELQSQVGPDGP
jgi:Protein of unknown function (DUF4065)